MAVFDLYAPGFDADPFPVYRRLRDEHPCYWHEGVQKWFLTRHADVSAAAADWQRFSSSTGNLVDEFAGRAGNTLGTTDPPRHDRLRALVQMAFTRKHLAAQEPWLRETVRGLLGALHGTTRLEFVGEFSTRLTVAALSRLLGLSHGDPTEIRANALLMVQTDPATRAKGPEQLAAMDWMQALARRHIADKRRDPREDVISRLVQAEIDGERLSESELVLTVSTVIMAGVESLSGFLAMTALNLADHPQVQRAARADPALIPAVIEETLRYNTNAQRFKRVATCEIALHGETIRAGDEIVLCFGAANRDERRFDDPDLFELSRVTRGHLGLGGGVHVCLGAVLARLVTRVFLEEFLAAVAAFTRAPEPLDWLPSSNFRAPAALPLELAG